MRPSEEPLLSAEAIASRVADLGNAIAEHYDGAPVVLLCVLKGGLFFTADLARTLPGRATVDFIRAKSYDGVESTGTVTLVVEPTLALEGRHVVVVEDILDTGRTATAILERIREENPASVALCTLLDKPSRRVVPIEADFVGFTIGEYFVVGYGLDHDERYRELPAVHVLEPDGD